MSAPPVIRVLPSGQWARAVADAWEQRLRARPSLRMCLPTGSTPSPVYGEMAQRQVSWASAEVVLLDEWVGLAPGDPAGCDATLRRQLLDGIDLPEPSYRRIDADAVDLAAECAGVDAWLDAGLDLVVLGVGANGHLGMNEPGTDPSTRTHRVRLAAATVESAGRYFGDRPRPTHGVTVGLRDILAAREVWVLATGTHKAAVVRDATSGRPRIELPASLLQAHPRCMWWLDEAAAAG